MTDTKKGPGHHTGAPHTTYYVKYTSPVDWNAVREFVSSRVNGIPHIEAGTSEWVELADDDPAKTAALLVAGSRWVLEQAMSANPWREHPLYESWALKQAALAVVTAGPDWGAEGRAVRQRAEAIASGAHIERVIV